ncbi:MAG: hypothetical protein ACOC6F_02790, partial [bacterium]
IAAGSDPLIETRVGCGNVGNPKGVGCPHFHNPDYYDYDPLHSAWSTKFTPLDKTQVTYSA